MTAKLTRSSRKTIIAMALAYYSIIFAFAFGLGAARGLIIAPLIGETTAVLIEILILLLASRMVARRLVHNRHFSFAQLLFVGAVAFGLTMVSEAALAGVIRHQSLSQWANSLTSPLGLVGLAGQIGFALMPTLTSIKIRLRAPK